MVGGSPEALEGDEVEGTDVMVLGDVEQVFKLKMLKFKNPN